MKGAFRMNKLNNKIIIELTDEQFEYLCSLCNTMYDGLKKFPKNMRTPNFYTLEHLINHVLVK